MAENKTLDYQIVQSIAVLSTSAKGWSKELNLVSWNGRQAKYDLREWSPDHEKMGKGVTFTADELKVLKQALEQLEAE